MKFVLLLLLSIVLFSCKQSGQINGDNSSQRDLNKPFSDIEIHAIKTQSATKERKLQYVLRFEDKVWGFFSDNTAYSIKQIYNLTESQVNRLIEGTPDHGYAITSDNKIWLDGEIPFDLNDNSYNLWLMIDYKWITPVELDFENFPDQDYVPNFGIRLLLNGACLDDYSNNDLGELEKAWVDNYLESLNNISADDWYILSYIKKDKKFIVEKTTIDTTHFHWDCGGFDMFSVSPASPKEKDLVFIAGINNMKEGEIKSHFHRQICVQPDQSYNFVFEGVEYKLRAEGILKEDWNKENELNEEGRIENGEVYQNYKLYLSSGNKEQLLLAIESFSDRYVTIEFIGDLDGDEKPDFLFETSTWYEDYKKSLFISSKAGENELVKFVASDGYSMAC